MPLMLMQMGLSSCLNVLENHQPVAASLASTLASLL